MEATESVRSTRGGGERKSGATVAILGGFVVAGVVTTLLGPILPVLISRWSLSDEQAGLFFTLQFISNIAGVASLSLLLPRWGYKVTLVLGYAGIAVGLVGLTARSQFGGMAATGVYGYGLGIVLSGSNLWVAEVTEARRVAALAILNFAWGVGAILCPPLVLLAERQGAIGWFLYGVAAAATCTTLALVAADLGVTVRREENAGGQKASVGAMSAIALAALFFLYVGTENAVAGWAAALVKRMGTAGSNLWALAPMFFWGGLMVGRAFVPVNPLRKRERMLVTTGLAMGLAGSGVLLATGTFWGVASSVGLTGLGFAAVYPVLVAWMAKQYGERARRVGSILFGLSALGGASMPWLVGFFSTREGSLKAGLVVPVAGCVGMLVFLCGVPKRVTG
jgi:MFS transporter, FHS family, glucose/mannose:H+ symporter